MEKNGNLYKGFEGRGQGSSIWSVLFEWRETAVYEVEVGLMELRLRS